MEKFSSCHRAINACNEYRQFTIAHLYQEEKPMNMHIHDCYEIYYSISGGKQFLIDNRFYDINPGDIFVINQYESHHITHIDSMIHERIVINIHPEFLRLLSTANTNLSDCFTRRELGFSHKLALNKEQQQRFLYFINKICSTSGFGSDLIEQSAFVELLVMVNAVFISAKSSNAHDMSYKYNQQVEEILEYINQNIRTSISIAHLAGHFYLSESYICRIFKSVTGTTINKYITARRITIAKALLTTGVSVNDTCEQCGFHDYSNFLKAFTKAVGISPKKYSAFSVS